MSKSLYTKTGSHTLDSNALGDETALALEDIWSKYLELGYSPREIAHVMQSAVAERELVTIVNRNSGKYETKT